MIVATPAKRMDIESGALVRFRAVRLRSPQVSNGVTFTAGARGIVVDVYPDGNYGVEFSAPAEDVLILKASCLQAA